MNPQIIDDALPKDYCDELESFLLNNEFPWYYINNIAMNDVIDANYLRVGFGHVFYAKKNEHTYNKELCSQINYIVDKTIGGTIKQSRAFLHIPVPENIRAPRDTVHVDYKLPHKVCLYYVNDSDGDTILFDKTYETGDETQPMQIAHRVSPKKGRVLVFDGRYYHCSTPPTTKPRCIINFNVV
jgi:ribosomal protein L32